MMLDKISRMIVSDGNSFSPRVPHFHTHTYTHIHSRTQKAILIAWIGVSQPIVTDCLRDEEQRWSFFRDE